MLKFSAKRDELIKEIAHNIELEEALISDITTRINQDAHSLEYTLSSAVVILKDLISRSNSMKEPILKIMSGLQTHDIVNQDIEIISKGLKIIHSFKDCTIDSTRVRPCLLFQERATSLSCNLISQLIEVIREHGTSLTQGIEHIEKMVSQVKEDKDAIGDFLLTNQSGESTFDIVISEVSALFRDLAARIHELGTLKESQQPMINQLSAFLNDLEQYAGTCSIGVLPEGTMDGIFKMVAPLKAQARMMKFGSGAQDLSENMADFLKIMDQTRVNLQEIKKLLIGSIKGIDIYSDRCINAITRFKQDIQKLMTTLEGSDGVIEDLGVFVLYISRILDGIEDISESEELGALSEEHQEILYRLENPHSNSLMKSDGLNDEDGLTLF